MQHSLISKSIVFLLIFPILINSAISKDIEKQLISTQLEEILNQKKYTLLKDLFLQNSLKKFDKHYLGFTKNYKDTEWSIKTMRNEPNKAFLDVRITSRREIDEKIYNLNTKQTVEIETSNNKIKSYKVINEESILNSQKSPLVVKIISPDQVLTGERYEINLILEHPLDKSLIASGMIVLKNDENINIYNDRFGIKINQAGGLFKYIRAPLKPGSQTISAIITHPEGIYSITKKIKVGL